jgi:hypothetical protein
MQRKSHLCQTDSKKTFFKGLAYLQITCQHNNWAFLAEFPNYSRQFDASGKKKNVGVNQPGLLPTFFKRGFLILDQGNH